MTALLHQLPDILTRICSDPSLRRLYEPTPIDSTAGTTQDGKVVKTPTLLIIGERDPVIPRDRSEVLARHHANIRIVSHDGGESPSPRYPTIADAADSQVITCRRSRRGGGSSASMSTHFELERVAEGSTLLRRSDLNHMME